MKTEDFEARLEQAKAILDKLMDSQLTLEQSVKAYEEGMEAIKAAQQLLEQAQQKVEIIRNETSLS